MVMGDGELSSWNLERLRAEVVALRNHRDEMYWEATKLKEAVVESVTLLRGVSAELQRGGSVCASRVLAQEAERMDRVLRGK